MDESSKWLATISIEHDPAPSGDPVFVSTDSLGSPGGLKADALIHLGLNRETIYFSSEIIAGYTPDDADAKTDCLNISRDVKALCLLIAAREVNPPLSIGLFGNWGSGKTFFMRRMEQELNLISEEAANGNVQSYREHIVQIFFNVWRYIDGDLWASLIAEIFEQLALAVAKKQTSAEKQVDPELIWARLMNAALGAQAELAEAEDRKKKVKQEIQRQEGLRDQVKRNESGIADLKPEAILSAAVSVATNTPEVADSITDAAKTLGIPEFRAETEEIRKELLQMNGSWKRLLRAHARNDGAREDERVHLRPRADRAAVARSSASILRVALQPGRRRSVL